MVFLPMVETTLSTTLVLILSRLLCQATKTSSTPSHLARERETLVTLTVITLQVMVYIHTPQTVTTTR
ncbi:MAG TPA: hypothetical protein VLN58_02235 [Verrucomicrobiae bacterium]|nr:hypothetical protein [Verrucomicrobiae bacterium]